MRLKERLSDGGVCIEQHDMLWSLVWGLQVGGGKWLFAFGNVFK